MVIFLAGTHGVGKTFLGKPAAESTGCRYATASSLIRDELGGMQNWEDNKRTKNVNGNQEALVAAVFRIVENDDVTLVLDGHFVLRNESGGVVSLPSDIYRRLGLSSVILIESPAPVVASRLKERGTPQSIEDISELAEAELRRAECVCKEIGIPLTKLVSPSKEQLLSALQEAGGPRNW
ncbi:Putative adenylate kinase [Alloalcanivorax dieselolei B5]|uniref:Putative adenylate kinase n=1 Tax=Alcanivorax dieselolei (strain DSM 16502 / CGMCC 1.3690 / MCCC 1A00001 / B-5) TaxID=930169 RepID=K0CCS4_ALCDB|nr:ATP-binding protein [Alloalcanivorax dieselolei]AFT71379.1 Putative adenylate kinase [Alloalcanivorax dieselolei B5]GGK08369.1 hypothetical protein GCM10007426_40870 [Alloalcanivorax dieselolei]